jgi:uncharacterized repeat protein (TIGR01451 family)
MRTTHRGRRIYLLSLIVLLVQAMLPFTVTAADDVSVVQEESVFNVLQVSVGYSFSLNVTNKGNNTYSGISAEIGKLKGFEGAKFVPGAETIGPRETKTYFFTVDIDRTAEPGNVNLPITFYHSVNGTKEVLVQTQARFSVGRLISSVSGYDAAILDMAYKLENPEGLRAGVTNVLTVIVTNRGNTMLADVKVSLTLPDNMTINNSVGVQTLGSLGIGEEKTVKFPILPDKKSLNKNHPITVKLSGTGRGSSSASSEQTIYIPVTGGEDKKEDENINMEISAVSAPAQITAGDEFTVSFNVKNIGEGEVLNAKIEAVPETGAANKTKNVFVEAKMAPGEQKSYLVTFLTDKDSGKMSVPVKLTVSAGSGDKAFAVSQYASVYLEKVPTPPGIKVKNPQLVVDNYSYGGGSVSAGGEFDLNVSFFNTSAKDITNVKVTLTSDTGAFIPRGSSNSMYISEIPAGSRVSRGVTMSVSPSAEQKTTAINVAMGYEDADGAYTSTDIISIPVVQVTELSVDDIIAPPELMVGVQTGLEVKYYNTGKTVLQNLRVVAEGNFDIVDSASYYGGNLASGASDSFSFGFTPREAGELKGTVTFTFDDPSGKQLSQEKDFSFMAAAMPEEQPMDGSQPEGAVPTDYKKYYIAGGVLAGLIIVSLLIVRSLKRRRMHREMEMDDDL